MSRSLPLSAYLALRRGGVPEGQDVWTVERPPGPLLWAHCSEAAHLGALADLVDRLRADGDRLAVLATLPEAQMASRTVTPPGIVVQTAPADKLRPARDFLAHWRPDILLWLGLPLRPVLLDQTRSGPHARFLVCTASDAALLDGGNWMPGIARSTLALFSEVMATDGDSLARLRKAGATEGRVRLVGPFEPGGQVLPHVESDRRELAALLGARPIWYAADVPEAELATVLDGHKLASRRAHRLMLILGTDAVPVAEAMCQERGLRWLSRSSGADPDDSIDVLVTDTSEPGLWFRLAPLSYLGGTFSGAPCRDPFESAALGSAILHGPQMAAHQGHFAQLRAAGALRLVARAEDLGHALESMLAPDKIAALAHAAWGVTSEGAETGNRISAMLRDALDRQGV